MGEGGGEDVDQIASDMTGVWRQGSYIHISFS